MPLLKRTKEDILSNIRIAFSKIGKAAVRVPGTPENITAELSSNEFAAVYNSLEFIWDGVNLSTSSSGDLDRLAEESGIARGLAEVAEDSSGFNVKFYINPRFSGDAQDLATQIGESDITIPKGTEISDGGNRIYYTTTDVTFGDNEEDGSPVFDFVFVDVIAFQVGTNVNVITGELNQHNLSAHITLGPIADNIFVLNLLPISTGVDLESDNDLRFRISIAFSANAASNNNSILQAARSVPGVAEAFIIPNVFGTGTFAVSIDADVPILSPGIINNVQAVVDSVKAAGTKAFVLYPEYIGLRFKIELIYDSITTDIKKSVESIIKASIVNYVNNTKRGETLVLNKVLTQALTQPEVKNAQVNQVISGNYNITTQAIENQVNLVLVDQLLNSNQKWFTATGLIELCEAS